MFEKTGSCYANFKDGQIRENPFRTENTGASQNLNPKIKINSADFNPSATFISAEKTSDYYTFQVK